MASKKVGVISINLTAGTVTFISELDRANAKVTDFTGKATRSFQEMGSHSVSSMQATSGGLRLLEGNFTNNIRASERFLATTLGLGPVLQSAFPLIGGLAFGGLLVDLGSKAYEFFKKMETAPERVAGAFRELNAPMRTANDELRVGIDRLQMEIDKLQGHHTNTLALSLDEARLAADRLFDSIQKDISGLNKLLQTNATSFMDRLLGMASDVDLKRLMGGQSGMGGVGLDLSKAIAEGNNDIDKAVASKDPKAVEAAREEAAAKANGILAAALAKVNDQLKIHRQLQQEDKAAGRSVGDVVGLGPSAKFWIQDYGTPRDTGRTLSQDGRSVVQGGSGPTVRMVQNEQDLIEKLEGSKLTLEQTQQHIPLMLTTADMTAQQEKLQSDAGNAKMDRPFEDRIKAMKAQLAELQAKLASVGQTDAFKALTEGKADAVKVIEEVNKALERYHAALSPAQKAEITDLAVKEKQVEVETAYQTKLDATTRAVRERIAAAEMLTAAVGKGYEAVKAASVETQLMTERGREYIPPAQEKQLLTEGKTGDTDHDALVQRASDQSAQRSDIATEKEAQHGLQVSETVDKLKQQIAVEQAVLDIQERGASAIAATRVAYEAYAMVLAGASQQEIADMIRLSDIRHASDLKKELIGLNEKLATTEAITAAELQGAEAVRKAGLEAKYAQMAKENKYGEATGGVIATTRQLDEADHQAKVLHEALATSQAFSGQLEKLNAELAVISQLEKQQGATRDLELDRSRIEKEIADTLAKQALATGSLMDGLRAFITEASADAEKPGKILYDGLNKAVDTLSGSITKAMDGEKANWGKTFKNLGQEMQQQAVKSMLQQGVGFIGKKLGLNLSKADGQSANTAWWVRIAGQEAIDKGNRLGRMLSGKTPSSASSPHMPGVPDLGNNTPGSNSPDWWPERPSVLKGAGGFGGVTPTGEPGDPVHVIQDQGQQGKGQDIVSGIMGGLGGQGGGGLSGILGSLGGGGGAASAAGGAGESVSSSISFGGEAADFAGAFADGGYLAPGQVGWAGEDGPEPIFGGKHGLTVYPNSSIGGESHTHYHVDARNADIGAAGRIYDSIERASQASVARSVAANRERSMRTPGRH